MNRLVQGDVGSGKTAVAQLAMYKAVKSGYQAAMMAPTELLSKQHYANLSRSFAPFGIRTALLSSSTKAAERRELLTALAAGEIDILIGTHRIDLLSLFDPKPAPQFQRGGNRGGSADTEPSHHAQGRQIATFHPGKASAEVRQQSLRQPDGRIPGIAVPKQNAQQFGIRQRRRSLRNQFFAHLFVRNR